MVEELKGLIREECEVKCEDNCSLSPCGMLVRTGEE